MSRCLPYPPPGYSLSRSSNEALIESIKLQKRVKSKEQRKKEKRREKKENKNENHEKSKEKKDKTTKKMDTLSTQIVKKVWEDTHVDFVSKTRETETKQLDRSNLTSEHEQPMCLDGPSSSFDSTETSNKRRHSSPVVDCSRRHGNIIRIRLTSKKQNESNTPPVVQHCSTSRRSDFPAQKEDANIGQPIALKTDRAQICAPTQPVVTIASSRTKKRTVENAVMTPMQRAELEYKNLIEDWTPPQLQLQLQDIYLDQDSDWLFSSKKPDVCAEKRRKCRSESVSCSALWPPRAQYLNEVDVYALPFTVPF